MDTVHERRAGEPPLIDSSSDHREWLKALEPFIPPGPPATPAVLPVLHKPGKLQLLLITASDLPKEVHSKEQESFLILEGECICRVGDTDHYLKPGSYFEVPLNAGHTVHVRSERLVAIMQRLDV